MFFVVIYVLVIYVYIKKSDLSKKIMILIIFSWFLCEYHYFFCYPDPRFLKWIRPNEVDPGGVHYLVLRLYIRILYDNVFEKFHHIF